jgi:aminodeoxyfutalosine deaminase
VLPIVQPPIRHGWVAIEDGLVAAVGYAPPPASSDLGSVAVLPALVNAHTHLELSHLRGAVAPTDRFVDWIRAVIAARRRSPDASDPVILNAARFAIEEARASGTGLIGDVSNTLVTAPLLEAASMPARVFYELLGFNEADPAERVRTARADAEAMRRTAPNVRVSLAAHAPYSVSPAFFAAIRTDLDAHAADISSVHVGESPEEVEFIGRGTGPWRQLLDELGVWTDVWRAPGGSPVRYLSDIGFIDSRVLAVHAVQCTSEDLSGLKALGSTLVSCPRSNRHVGVGDPPLERFYAADIPVAFGTDSLASVADLNMFAELAAARRLAPNVPASDLLESATRSGARALGFGSQYGSIEPGRRASLIAVRLPEGVTDVEEYLLSGVELDAIAWLETETPNPKSQ